MIDCKTPVAKRKADIKKRVEESIRTPRLVIFQVGDNEASKRYVKHRMADCKEVGIDAELVWLPEDFTTDEIAEHIKYIIQNIGGSAYMVQLPLPKHINTDYITNLIPPIYDVDGLSDYSMFTPCAAKGVMMLLDDIGEDVRGKHVVVLGRSKLVGKPLVNLLIDRQATVSCLNSQTQDGDRYAVTQRADVIISAVGIKDSLTPRNVCIGATIVDVGINFDENGKMCGDCTKEVYDWNNKVTPVPNGVGLYTRVALLENILEV